MKVRHDNIRCVHRFKNGVARVENKQGMWNFINHDYELLSRTWFAYAEEFEGGLAMVENDYGAKNFLNPKGFLISNKWFESVGNFIDGFCVVTCKRKQYLIDRTGHIVYN